VSVLVIFLFNYFRLDFIASRRACSGCATRSDTAEELPWKSALKIVAVAVIARAC
jgi:hypothetical protein